MVVSAPGATVNGADVVSATDLAVGGRAHARRARPAGAADASLRTVVCAVTVAARIGGERRR